MQKGFLALVLAALLLRGTFAVPKPEESDSSHAAASSSAIQTTPVPDHLPDLILREADCPVFPQRPTAKNHPDGEPDSSLPALQTWREEVTAFRGDPLDDSTRTALLSFAATSADSALNTGSRKSGLYSPISLWMALAMLGQCSAGESQEQVLHALGLPDAGSLPEQANRLWHRLYTDDGSARLFPGNSLWLNGSLRGTSVPKTLDTLAREHHADLFCTPMGTKETDQAIAAWIADQTCGLLGTDENIVQTAPDTLALLLSSLYCNVSWNTPFLPEQTREDIFTAADGTRQTVPVLHDTRSGPFRLEDGWQSASLPLSLGSAIFVLPAPGVDPGALLRDPAFLPQLLNPDRSALHRGSVQWSIPRLDLSCSSDLLDTLRNLGVQDLLDPARADLSALSSASVWVGAVQQMTRLKLEEEGVEAATVTSVEAPTSAPPVEEPEVLEMNLNRPFLLVVEADGLPLFVSTVRTLKQAS